MRYPLVAIAAAGIAAIATAAQAEIKPQVRTAIVACMLQSDEPRPFRVKDESGWNDYSFDGADIEFYSVDAQSYYRKRCRAIAQALAQATIPQ